MPPFVNLDDPDVDALLAYLKNADAPDHKGSVDREMASVPAGKADRVPYQFTGYRKFEDPDGYPAITPPWGTLNAIDLNTGKYLWRVPLGEYPELAAKGMRNTGSESYGGPLATGGGVLFIGATIFDHKFRAFDTKDGSLLWEDQLPAAAICNPATYMIDGKQYIVIVASAVSDAKQGNSAGKSKTVGRAVYIAYALP